MIQKKRKFFQTSIMMDHFSGERLYFPFKIALEKVSIESPEFEKNPPAPVRRSKLLNTTKFNLQKGVEQLLDKDVSWKTVKHTG